MSRAAQIYDFSMAPGETFVLPVEGTYYRIRSASGSVRVKRDDGSMLLLEVGQGENNQLFRRLTIEDTSGAANSGTIIVADNNFVDERVSGEVLTMNGSAARTLARLAFFGGANLSGLAANYSMVQLWNPVGSGKRIQIDTVRYASFTNLNFTLRRNAAALSTLVQNSDPKLLNAATGVAEIRTEQAAALSGTMIMANMITPNGQGTTFINFQEPIILLPGNGIIVANSTVNATVQANFDFLEVPQ